MTTTQPIERLLVVGPTPPPVHGVSVMILELIEALEGLGVYAGHLDTRDPRPHNTIGRLDWRNIVLAITHACRLSRSLRRDSTAAVYIPLSQSTWGFARDALLIFLARLHHRRVYAHFHGGHFDRFYRTQRWAMRLLIRRAMACVHRTWALTPSLRRVFDGLVPAEHVSYLQNVVPHSWFAAANAAITSKSREHASFGILYVSNMVPEKNCFDLLSACALVATRLAGAHIKLVGYIAPDIKARLHAECDALQRAGITVEAMGELTGAAKLQQYQWADIFAYPTRFDGQPLVLLEALAMGIPVVSTMCGGIPDTVVDGREALLTTVGDIDAFARALVTMAENPELRKAIGDAGRVRCQRDYQPLRLTEDLKTLLASHSA